MPTLWLSTGWWTAAAGVSAGLVGAATTPKGKGIQGILRRWYNHPCNTRYFPLVSSDRYSGHPGVNGRFDRDLVHPFQYCSPPPYTVTVQGKQYGLTWVVGSLASTRYGAVATGAAAVLCYPSYVVRPSVAAIHARDMVKRADSIVHADIVGYTGVVYTHVSHGDRVVRVESSQ
jgi:hypothetical protein